MFLRSNHPHENGKHLACNPLPPNATWALTTTYNTAAPSTPLLAFPTTLLCIPPWLILLPDILCNNLVAFTFYLLTLNDSLHKSMTCYVVHSPLPASRSIPGTEQAFNRYINMNQNFQETWENYSNLSLHKETILMSFQCSIVLPRIMLV